MISLPVSQQSGACAGCLSAVFVAVACQVYRGVLRETGESVAVKVQRPGIGESIAVDMLLLRRLMAVVDNNLPQVIGRGCCWADHASS